VSVTGANGGNCGKIRPNSMLLAGAPGGSECPAAPAPVTAARAVAGRIPGSMPADAAARPAPAVPAPAKSLRRERPAALLSSLIVVALPLSPVLSLPSGEIRSEEGAWAGGGAPPPPPPRAVGQLPLNGLTSGFVLE
jgi:hypothetical protein